MLPPHEGVVFIEFSGAIPYLFHAHRIGLTLQKALYNINHVVGFYKRTQKA
jgi:hypothetical protein